MGKSENIYRVLCYLANIPNIEISKAFAKDCLHKNLDEGCVFKESSYCKVPEAGFENLNIGIGKISVLL